MGRFKLSNRLFLFQFPENRQHEEIRHWFSCSAFSKIVSRENSDGCDLASCIGILQNISW